MAHGVTCSRFAGPIFARKFQFSGMSDSGRGRGRTIKRSKFSEAQIAFILRQAEEGTAVGEVCRKAGISEATYYNWRKMYAGLTPSEMKRLTHSQDLHAHSPGGTSSCSCRFTRAIFFSPDCAGSRRRTTVSGPPPVSGN
jgi:putative transposase